jgi:hypothetical protein
MVGDAPIRKAGRQLTTKTQKMGVDVRQKITMIYYA